MLVSNMLVDFLKEQISIAFVSGRRQTRRLDDSIDPFAGPSVKSAFSLVELLVVIAIIGTLAALLLPALSGAKLHAQQIQCINSLKQLALAHSAYVTESGREFQDFAGLGYMDPWANALRLYYGSYAFNGWLWDAVDLSTDPGFFHKPSAVVRPSLTPVFADAIWHDVSPDPRDLPCSNLYLGGLTGVNGYVGISALTIARHGSRPASAAPTHVNTGTRLPGAIDVALFDGHVEKPPLENLWNYYWSATWQIPNPRPGRIP